MLKIVEHLIEHIEDEIEGAKEYAEKYIEARAWGDNTRANKYKEMASDELRHASYVHEFAAQDVGKYQAVYSMSEEDMQHWEHANKRYAECVASLKTMLNM